MAQKYWFFNSASGDTRAYQAADFARYFGLVLTSGLFSLDNQIGLRVRADGTDMRSYVETGKALIKGFAYENDADEYLLHDLPEVTNNRIDRVVLRLDLRNQNRFIKVFVKSGVADAAPVPPELQRDNFIYELSLAQILVRANTSTINPADITDERLDEQLCGIVNSMITVPTSQFQNDWNAWYAANIPQYESEWQDFIDGLAGATFVQTVNGTGPDVNGNVEVAIDTTAIDAELDAMSAQIGILSGLNTTDKSNLVNAVNELFTDVGNGKTQIATAITDKGVTASGSDTFPQLASKIDQLSVELDGEIKGVFIAGDDLKKGDRVQVRLYSSPVLVYPDVNPPNGTRASSFSPNGKHLAMLSSASPYLTFYKVSDDGVFTKLPNPSILPTGTPQRSAYSPDGTHFVVGHSTAPYITIYKVVGDTYIKLPNPDVLPLNSCRKVSFSPDGVHLAVSVSGSNNFIIYKRDGDSFSKLPDLVNAPVNSTFSDFSPDGKYLALTTSISSKGVCLFKREGDVFTELPPTGTMPNGIAQSCVFSPESDILYVGQNTAEAVLRYAVSENGLSKLSNSFYTGSGNATNLQRSYGGGFILLDLESFPFFTMYRVSQLGTTTNMSLTSPDRTLFGASSLSPDGRFIAHVTQESPYIRIRKRSDTVFKSTGSFSDAFSVGYAKQDATVGQLVECAILFE
ncbi:MAG: WD40 repeat domain-containing protein [Exiguobacterium sp.]|uniref:WD40 repeat domain-containing protein n=1 Tax=Exiguobacterium sp. TaxID=44751 RepID=UPI00257DD845|nr:WD40 repeat domain-containing protein [Exiguobacterium sp.]MBQ6459127.1 WD40 repeat domain-containing protein [Exiguobacterium sp.]MBR3215444.1 WD40 repeat domain-containing protein [Exiguobacterium sp.]